MATHIQQLEFCQREVELMKNEPLRLEVQDKVEQHSSLRSAHEERLVLSMVLELYNRFGINQAHDVASVLKVSHDEAKDLLILAALKD
jgi:hypothetical protein